MFNNSEFSKICYDSIDTAQNDKICIYSLKYVKPFDSAPIKT